VTIDLPVTMMSITLVDVIKTNGVVWFPNVSIITMFSYASSTWGEKQIS
jgi:hypothetical protein